MILNQEEINQLQKFMTDHGIDNVTWFMASYTRMTLTLNNLYKHLSQLSSLGDIEL